MKTLDKIVDMVIDALENGSAPWRKTWKDIVPMNVFSDRPYKGMNLFILSYICQANKYTYPFFATFKQITNAGGTVKKGSKAYPVVFWKVTRLQGKATDQDGNEETEIKKFFTPFYYNVFNLDQTEGIDIEKYVKKRFTFNNNNPLEVCEKVVTQMQHPPRITHDQPGAFYVPYFDTVNVPEIRLFNSSAEYYATFFHELAHSTGHSSRLNRFENSNTVFGSQSYSFEELVAEMTATLLCSQCGIDQTIENSVSYLKGWATYLKSERKTALFGAATKAQAAADYILGTTMQSEQPEQVEECEEAEVF